VLAQPGQQDRQDPVRPHGAEVVGAGEHQPGLVEPVEGRPFVEGPQGFVELAAALATS